MVRVVRLGAPGLGWAQELRGWGRPAGTREENTKTWMAPQALCGKHLRSLGVLVIRAFLHGASFELKYLLGQLKGLTKDLSPVRL